jgi:hypothetical protein
MILVPTEVRVVLTNQYERALYGEFISIIEASRAHALNPAPLVQKVPTTEVPVTVGPPAFEEKVIASITPAGVMKPEPAKGPTLEEMEDAVMAYLKTTSVPVTRDLLDQYAPGKRMADIDPKHWPELLSKLVAK